MLTAGHGNMYEEFIFSSSRQQIENGYSEIRYRIKKWNIRRKKISWGNTKETKEQTVLHTHWNLVYSVRLIKIKCFHRTFKLRSNQNKPSSLKGKGSPTSGNAIGM